MKEIMEMGNPHGTISFIFFIIIAVLSLIQIAPIKVNPWDSLLRWIGEGINGDMQKEFREFWVDSHRQAILSFCRECRNDVDHSREEWNYILDILAKYNRYCELHKIVNGVIEEDSRYIRELYHDLCKSGKL